MISRLRLFTLAALALAAAALAPAAAGGAGAPDATPLALAACEAPLATPFDPVEAAPCAGIRPGGPLTGPSGNGAFCTLAWALTSGGVAYMTTAGHCVSVGARYGTEGVGAFGTAVYRLCGATPLFETCEPGSDYALIRVDADKAHLVSNALCGWGTPTAIFDDHDAVPRKVMHHGYGLVTGTFDATRARAGVSSHFLDERKFGFEGAAAPGDSGSAAMVSQSPVFDQFEALGIITHIVAYTEADPDPVADGTVTGTRLDVAVRELNAALGLDLRLL